MKKTEVVMLAIVTLAVVGCKKKEEAPKVVAPQGGMQVSPGAAPGGDATGGQTKAFGGSHFGEAITEPSS